MRLSKGKCGDIILYVIIYAYLIVVLYFTVFSRDVGVSYEYLLVPFQSIADFVQVEFYSHGQYILKEILINLALLMPIGFLLSLKGMDMLKVIVIGFSISLLIESIQFVTKTGVFEVDDLIYNTLGATLSCCFISIFRRLHA